MLNPYDIDATPQRLLLRLAAPRPPPALAAITIGTETSRLDRQPAAAQGDVGLRPTVGLVSPHRHPADLRLAGHGRADHAHGRRRRRRAAGDRRQGPRGPGHRRRARDRPELPRRAHRRRAQPASGSASSTTPTRSTRPRSPAIQALGATTVQIPTPDPGAELRRTSSRREFKRDLNAYLGRLPASAPMKSLADIIAYNTAHADEALKFGQAQLTASQAIDLSDPAHERRLRRQPRRRPRRRPRRDRHRADDEHARRDHDAVGHADRHRRPRRLPADRRPRRATTPPTALPGRHRLQRHRLQRGEAARVRLRVRAGDASCASR